LVHQRQAKTSSPGFRRDCRFGKFEAETLIQSTPGPNVAAERVPQSSLKLRILSALVLAPVALATVWLGGPYLVALTMAAAAVMAWEWARLCGGGALGRTGAGVIGLVSFAVLGAALHGVGTGMMLAVLSAFGVWVVARDEARRDAAWLAAGMLWVALPCVLLLWLAQGVEGRSLLLWTFAVVWATDIGAYVIGRRLGGPRLAPSWSPRKTWAGLAGGIVCAAFAGWIAGHLLAATSVLPLVLLSAGLAIVEQFGDLAESVAKRRFGVKDTSALIPGHGGLLDRLDGLLAVIPAVALLSLIGGGSILQWR
jgi:phosphatidate cytidylyltransferase